MAEACLDKRCRLLAEVALLALLSALEELTLSTVESGDDDAVVIENGDAGDNALAEDQRGNSLLLIYCGRRFPPKVRP